MFPEFWRQLDLWNHLVCLGNFVADRISFKQSQVESWKVPGIFGNRRRNFNGLDSGIFDAFKHVA